jgi:hypothetical protein
MFTSIGKSTMSNPLLDSQVKTALHDEKTAEKFAEHIAELTAQIVNATFKFAQDVKVDSKKKTRRQEFWRYRSSQARPGCVQLLYACSRSIFYPCGYPDYESMVFDFIFGNVVKPVYAKTFTGPPAQTEKFVLDQVPRTETVRCGVRVK